MQPPPRSAQPLAQPWMKKQLRFAPQQVLAGRAAARARPPQHMKRLRVTFAFFALGMPTLLFLSRPIVARLQCIPAIRWLRM